MKPSISILWICLCVYLGFTYLESDRSSHMGVTGSSKGGNYFFGYRDFVSFPAPGILEVALRAAKTETLSGPYVRPRYICDHRMWPCKTLRHGHRGILNESAVSLGTISLSFFVLLSVRRKAPRPPARARTLCGLAISAPDSRRTYWPDFWSRWNFQR